MSLADQTLEALDLRPRAPAVAPAPREPVPLAPAVQLVPELELPKRPIPLRELLAEDFATYDRNLTQPGLWAVVAHRLGDTASRQPAGLGKALLEAAHRTLATTVDLVWGIQLPRSVQLGRRVRIWHSGCMLLNAKMIGDDVHLRHGTTLGPLRGMAPQSEELPVLEARVELGVGVCVLGDVCVGHDSFVGANSLVIKPVSPNSVVLGVPARQVPR